MVKLSYKYDMLSLLLSFIIICNPVVLCEANASCNQKDKQILLCFNHGLTDPLACCQHGPTQRIVVNGEEFIVTSMAESQISASLVPLMMTTLLGTKITKHIV